MKIFIVGTGMDGCCTLTAQAAEAVRCAELIVGAERMTAPYRSSGKKLVCAYKPEETAELLKNSGVDCAAVLMSGDTGFYSGTKKLLPLLDFADTKVIAGISSLSYLCAAAGIPCENVRTVSLHGRCGSIAVNVRLNPVCFFLLGGDMSAGDVCRRLVSFGLGDAFVFIGERLGYDDERIVRGKASELTDYESGKLAVMLVSNPDALGYVPSAVSDEEFIRDKVPMTKAFVRCCAVAELDICRDSVCWDIGCGSGSVSVEMAYRCPDGKVLAFDKSPDAVRLTEENSRKFSADNILSVCGFCPDILRDAQAPDKVFIGGSSGALNDIFDLIRERAPKADIVVTAVSLETLHQAVGAFEMCGGSCSVSQVAVTDTHKVGSHTMLRAQNPVFIIKGRLV